MYEPTKELRERTPHTYQGFTDLHRGALEDGELSGAVKELIAVAIAVHDGCDGCIAAHVRGPARKGATEQQFAEALGVALLMGGGPASVNAPRAWEAFKEFQPQAV
ncbi:MAG: carboxymuconolactone decarboxylase family protein [Acidimicrobiia bacterium]|nr:carboxymuconolactone decarboxylase family protein [Acidimicrobiia bacterium]